MNKNNVQYRYALNEKNELIEVHDAHTQGGVYHCPQCGKKMIYKCGSQKAWHFAHDKAECDYNKYLHTIAEKRVLEWFNTANEIPLVLRTNMVCNKANICKFYHDLSCKKEINSNAFNLRQYYSKCEIEKTYDKNGHKFIADLLCKPNNVEHEPLFIEICVTHPCDQEKINSGIRIIEFVIKSEEDIDDIINKTIKESNNIRLYNFHPNDIEYHPDYFEGIFKKFIVFRSKKAYVDCIYCRALHHRRGIIEISIVDNIFFSGFSVEDNFFNTAFAVATKYDSTLRHCCLCKYHVFDVWEGYGICRLFKKYGTNREASKNNAYECSYYRPDVQSIQKRIMEFDDYCRRYPVDIWIKPT